MKPPNQTCFAKNDVLAELGPHAQLLFALLPCHADREGRLEDRSRRLKVEIFPYYDVDVDKLLDSLATCEERFIIRYEVEGKRYIQINKFEKHQSPHHKEEDSLQAIDQHGSSQLVTFDDGLINVVVRLLGGWQRCCTLLIDEFEKWYRKDFCRFYLELLSSGCPPEQTAPLVGSLERENTRYVGTLTRWGHAYQLPPVRCVPVQYETRLKSLAAPKREVAKLPSIEFKRLDDVADVDPGAAHKPAQMAESTRCPGQRNTRGGPRKT